MRLRMPNVLVPGTRVKIRHPGSLESGAWVVVGRVTNSGTQDPAYDLKHIKSGRARIIRRSRLKLLKGRYGPKVS